MQGARGVWYFVVIGGIDRNTEHRIRGSENSLILFSVFRLLFFADLAATDSPAAFAAVPWALGALTAEFEMGSGGIPPLGPPGRRKTEVE